MRLEARLAGDRPLALWWSEPWIDLDDAARRTARWMRWTTERSRYSQADLVIVPIATAGADLPEQRATPDQVWVLWSQESCDNYPRLTQTDTVSKFDAVMSYRHDSDIPIPYFDTNLWADIRPLVPLTDRRPTLMSAWVSSGWDRCGRNQYLGDLVRAMSIDSFGAIHNTARLDDDQGEATKLAVISHYRFAAAFENSMTHDYVTEKFFQPLLVGSVPVVRGAPNIADFAPSPHAFIDATRFSDARRLGEYLTAMSDDEYLSMHTWRTDGSIERWRRRWALFDEWPLHRLMKLFPALRIGRQAATRCQQRLDDR